MAIKILFIFLQKGIEIEKWILDYPKIKERKVFF